MVTACETQTAAGWSAAAASDDIGPIVSLSACMCACNGWLVTDAAVLAAAAAMPSARPKAQPLPIHPWGEIDCAAVAVLAACCNAQALAAWKCAMALPAAADQLMEAPAGRRKV